MLKHFISLAILATILLNACNTNEVNNAKKFNDTLINSFDPIIERMIEFEMAIYDENADLESMYYEMKNFTDTILATIEKIPAYSDGDSLKARAIDVVKFYKRIIDEDYQKMLILLTSSDTLSIEAEAFIDFLLRESYKEEGKVMDAFEKEQKNFAKRHNFKIDNSVPTKQQPFIQ